MQELYSQSSIENTSNGNMYCFKENSSLVWIWWKQQISKKKWASAKRVSSTKKNQLEGRFELIRIIGNRSVMWLENLES